MKIVQRSICLLIAFTLLFSLPSCKDNENQQTEKLEETIANSDTLQEQIDVTKNKFEKLFDFPEIYSDNGIYSYADIPASMICIENNIFYITENNEFHCFDTVNYTDYTVSTNIDIEKTFYSDSYFIFYGNTDGYNNSWYLYDIKNKKNVSDESANTLMKKVFDYESDNDAVGLFGNSFCYTETKNEYNDTIHDFVTRSCLKYYNIGDGTETTIYTSPETKYRNEGILIYAVYREEYAGIFAKDTRSGFLYYSVICEDENAQKYEWKLFRYDFAEKTSSEIYSVVTNNFATGERRDIPSFEQVCAQNGDLYCFNTPQSNNSDLEIGVYCIENGEMKKLKNALPCENVNFLANDIIYYTSNSNNVVINGENILIVEADSSEEDRFLGVFNECYWYCGSQYLQTLNKSTNELEDKVLFNGVIIASDSENLYCCGKPVEKQEVTDIYGETDISFETGESGVYKVSINDTETETTYRDVFLVSDSDKSQAVSIVESAYANEILLYVKNPSIFAREYTYAEGTVTVFITGKFRFGNGILQDSTMKFYVDLSKGTCTDAGSLTWEMLRILNS